MMGAVAKARELAAQNPDYWEARQFDNPANPLIHRLTTGPEILRQVPEVDALVAGVLDREAYDEVIDVTYADALATSRRLAREEGIFSGISAGAIAWAALQAAIELGAGKHVVFIVPDFGERYGTHELWANVEEAALAKA
jgi:cysteine synthase A